MEMEAAIRFLVSILSKRGEKVKEQEIEVLTRWARKRGKLVQPLLLFDIAESSEIGESLWNCAIEGGKDGKEARELGEVWKKVILTLKAMSAEKQVAAAAIEALEKNVKDEKDEAAKPSRVARFFGVGQTRPMKGSAAPVCSSMREVLDRVAEKAEVTLPADKATEGKQEAAQPPNPGGVAQEEETGGAMGGTKPRREAKQEGGVQGGDKSGAVTVQGGDKSGTAGYPPLPDSDADSKMESPCQNDTQPPRKNVEVTNQLQVIIKKLSELSHRQNKLEEKTAVTSAQTRQEEQSPLIPPPSLAPVEPSAPPEHLLPLPAVPIGISKNPIHRRWTGVI